MLAVSHNSRSLMRKEGCDTYVGPDHHRPGFLCLRYSGGGFSRACQGWFFRCCDSGDAVAGAVSSTARGRRPAAADPDLPGRNFGLCLLERMERPKLEGDDAGCCDRYGARLALRLPC